MTLLQAVTHVFRRLLIHFHCSVLYHAAAFACRTLLHMASPDEHLSLTSRMRRSWFDVSMNGILEKDAAESPPSSISWEV